jgi:hypothetical protein
MAALTAAALLLAACIPEFANPVGGGAAADPAIVGAWRAAPKSDPSDVMLLDIRADGEGVTLTMTSPDDKGEKPLVFKGRTGTGSGGSRFVSIRPQGEDMGPDVGYFVFRYEQRGADIHVWSLDPEKLAAAVNAGKIAGTTSGQGTDTSVKVTAAPDEAAAFLESADGRAVFMTDDEDELILTKTAR